MTAASANGPSSRRWSGKFFANCAAKGYPAGAAQEVWRQIESFASFSFAKGHSASYAVESYQSLYLKAHHPLEFMVAVANNFGGFYSTEFYLHEAKRAGAVVEAPCVNRSAELCSLRRSRDQMIRRSGDQKMEMAGGAEMDQSTCTVDPMGRRDRCAPTAAHRRSIFLGLANIKSLTAETTQLLSCTSASQRSLHRL
jgi:DNA polymerase III alpha subunit